MTTSARLSAFLRVLFLEPAPLWLAFGFPVGLTRALLWLPISGAAFDDRVRWASGILQMCGAFVVVIGLIDKRALLDESSARAVASLWFRRLWSLIRPPASTKLNLGAAAGVFGVVASGTLAVALPDVESRLAKLESTLIEVRADIQGLRNDTKGVRLEVQTATTRLEAEVVALRRRLRDLVVGSAGWELAGLMWLLAGLLLGAFPRVAVLVGAGAA